MKNWEYLYALAENNEVVEVNNAMIGTALRGFVTTYTGRPTLTDFLNQSGQEGWELVGMSPMGEVGTTLRLIFKRPIN
ncbi:MAG: DUF4177 domain-containing protein [Chloroflexota bacterium]|jgi:hypothetical protein